MKDHPLLKMLTSLRVTIALLAISLIIIFLGTMSQRPMGLDQSLDRFFLSWAVDSIAMKAALYQTAQLFNWKFTPITPEQIVGPPGLPVFPGGFLVGSLLLICLTASFYRHFTWSAKKAGIYLTHLGIISLILGQIIIDVFKEESFVHMERGDRKDYAVSFQDNELAFLLPVTSDDGQVVSNRVVSIPEPLLKEGATLTHPELNGLSIKVDRYWKNASLLTARQLVELDRQEQLDLEKEVLETVYDIMGGRIRAMEEFLDENLDSEKREVLTQVKAGFFEVKGAEPNLQRLASSLSEVHEMEKQVFGRADEDSSLVFNSESVRNLLLKVRAYEDQRQIASLFDSATHDVLTGTNCTLNAFDSNATNFQEKIRLFPGETSDKMVKGTEQFVKRIRSRAKMYYVGADHGRLGRHFRFVKKELPVFKNDERDFPAALITVSHPNAKDKTVGTFLFSSSRGLQQVVEVRDDSEESKIIDKWKAVLRSKHHFIGFDLSLVDVKWDLYPGTEIPKNFSSKVVVEDGADPRTILIKMNEPLRNQGRTFYQQSMTKNQLGDAEQTTLQVVKNPDFKIGGLVVSTASIPYIGCIIVSAGLIYQFMLHLLGFTRRQKKDQLKQTENEETEEAGNE